VTVPKRIAALPDVPTFAEQGYPDYEASVWFAMVMPNGTPPDIVTRVREALVSALAAPSVAEAIRKQGYEAETSTPEALNALIHSEHQKWGRVIREANIRQD
jgi:tripartite-type tricarboxylate transporter receptor subunit TctC